MHRDLFIFIEAQSILFFIAAPIVRCKKLSARFQSKIGKKSNFLQSASGILKLIIYSLHFHLMYFSAYFKKNGQFGPVVCPPLC